MGITPVVRNLLIINIAVFALPHLLSGLFGGNMLTALLGLYHWDSVLFQPYQFVTYMFMHSDFEHILMNMFGLFMFGPLLETVWGPKRFFIFYMVCGLGAGALYAGINGYELTQMKQDVVTYHTQPNPDHFNSFLNKYDRGAVGTTLSFVNAFAEAPESAELQADSEWYVQQIFQRRVNTPMIGASGAIFGILIAFALLFPNTELMLLFPPIPIKAKYLVGAYGAYELYKGIVRAPDDNVAHYAHLGGMLFGFILVMLWRNTTKIKYRYN